MVRSAKKLGEKPPSHEATMATGESPGSPAGSEDFVIASLSGDTAIITDQTVCAKRSRSSQEPQFSYASFTTTESVGGSSGVTTTTPLVCDSYRRHILMAPAEVETLGYSDKTDGDVAPIPKDDALDSLPIIPPTVDLEAPAVVVAPDYSSARDAPLPDTNALDVVEKPRLVPAPRHSAPSLVECARKDSYGSTLSAPATAGVHAMIKEKTDQEPSPQNGVNLRKGKHIDPRERGPNYQEFLRRYFVTSHHADPQAVSSGALIDTSKVQAPLSSHLPPADTSIAGRIPQELFKPIVNQLIPWELVQKTPWRGYKAADTAEDVRRYTTRLKHELGQCSLVCRYWAKHCREPMFRNVELRAIEDARRLLEFVKTATLGIHIGMYVSTITLRITVPSFPWIHLVVNTIPQDTFPNLSGYWVWISETPFNGTPELKPFAPRSVLHGLPCTLSATKHPISLNLTKLRFIAFAHLVSFLDSFIAPKPDSCSGQLTLHQVTWADSSALVPSEIPAAFRGGRRCWKKCFKTIALVRCPAVWPLVWLLITAERAQPSENRAPPFVDGIEVRRLMALVQTVIDDCACTACGARKPGRATLKEEKPGKFDYEMFPDCTALKIWNAVHELVVLLSPDGHVANVLFHIRAPLVMIGRKEEPPESLGFDWATLDQRALALHTTVFSVWVPGKLYDKYEPFVRDHMPLTQSSGRLELGRWSENI